MPEDIIDFNKTDFLYGYNLSMFVNITQDAEGPFTITVKNDKDGEVIYTLNGMILAERFSLISHTMHTS